jgi:hypothetical protein
MNRFLLLFLFIVFFAIGCNDPEDGVNAEKQVNAFIIEMNPELYQTMSKMKVEIALADKKVPQLYELKGLYPNQRDMIEKSLKQWQGLRQTLNFTLKNIYAKVERAYVAYKIDEIQGKKKFSVISQTLLKEANAVLETAETTKSTIEEALYE